jgi:hypothetical protein
VGHDRARHALVGAPAELRADGGVVEGLGMRVGDDDGVRPDLREPPPSGLAAIDHHAAPAVADQGRGVHPVAAARGIDVAARAEEHEPHGGREEITPGMIDDPSAR